MYTRCPSRRASCSLSAVMNRAAEPGMSSAPRRSVQPEPAAALPQPRLPASQGQRPPPPPLRCSLPGPSPRLRFSILTQKPSISPLWPSPSFLPGRVLPDPHPHPRPVSRRRSFLRLSHGAASPRPSEVSGGSRCNVNLLRTPPPHIVLGAGRKEGGGETGKEPRRGRQRRG